MATNSELKAESRAQSVHHRGIKKGEFFELNILGFDVKVQITSWKDDPSYPAGLKVYIKIVEIIRQGNSNGFKKIIENAINEGKPYPIGLNYLQIID
jgi:hypothetical protein